MIPARLIGGPFWNVYYYNDPPIAQAYNQCVRYFGLDGFSHHGVYDLPPHSDTEWNRQIVEQSEPQLVVRTTMECPAGRLYQEETYLHNEPPTPTKKFIDDFEAQYDCLDYLMFGDVSAVSFETYKRVREDMGDNGVVGLCMQLPTLLTQWREPSESAFYDYYDHHDLVAAFIERWTDHLVAIAEQVIKQDVQPDFVFFPNSGMITLQSVEIMKELSLPALQKLTAMFKKAGIVTSLHCCGKERALVEAAAETDLDCIDPLEIPPMGDCDMAEIKQKFGKKLAIKGNLHTTEVMLQMNPAGVEKEAMKCLDAAMEGGGFILSTGDQCGRDTPDENIFKLVEVCERYGKY
jgi:uroporphyrinogen decarboxylase